MEVKDAHGNLLADGDSVVVMKTLKVKGSSVSVKKGACFQELTGNE